MNRQDFNLSVIAFINPLTLTNDFVNIIGNNYIITPVCCVGFLLNLICLAILLNPNIEADSYRYYQAKTASELVLTAIGCLVPISTCVSCPISKSLFAQVYILYGIIIVNDIAYMFNSFCQILIVYDGYLLLNKHTTCQTKLPKMISILVCLVISIGYISPRLMAYTIQRTSDNTTNDTYEVVVNEIGHSVAYFYYETFSSVAQEVFNFVLLLIFSILFAKDYGMRIRKKNRDIIGILRLLRSSNHRVGTEETASSSSSDGKHSSNENGNSQTRFNDSALRNIIVMVITLCCIYLVSRLIKLISRVYSLILTLNRMDSSFNQLFIYISKLILYISQSSGLFIYITFNPILLKSFGELLRKFKIR